METPKQNRVLKYRYYKYIPQAIIVGVILLVYIQNLWFNYVYLDDQLVFEEYKKIDSLFKIPGAFLDGYLFNLYYRPLVIISFTIDTFIAGQSSMMYHLSNIILHIFVSLLIYSFLIRVKLGEMISLLLTVFFAVHPINTNAVSWIVGRNDLLLALFTLLSFLSLIRYIDNGKQVFFALSALFYLFAMMSKETGLIIPVLFILYYFLFNGKQKENSKSYLVFLIYLIPVFVYLFLRKYVAKVIINTDLFAKSIGQQLYILFEFLGKIFYFPAIEPLPMKNNLAIFWGLLLILIVLISLIKLRNDIVNRRILIFGIIFFLISILPSLIVKIEAEDGKLLYYDCRAYLPLVGILIIIGAIIQSFWVKYTEKRRILLFFLLLSFVYTLAYNFIINSAYKNGEIFWSTVVKSHPERSTYWDGYANYYFYSGAYSKAVQMWRKAIQHSPNVTEYYYRTVNAYIQEGNRDSAIETLNRLLSFEKNKSRTFYNLLKLYIQNGDSIKADGAIKLLINDAFRSGRPEYIVYASDYCLKTKNIKMAIELIQALIKIEPNNAKFLNNYAIVLYFLGDEKSAKEYFYKALQLDPSNPEYLKNLNLVKEK